MGGNLVRNKDLEYAEYMYEEERKYSDHLVSSLMKCYRFIS